MVETSLVNLEIDPPTPTPSTSSLPMSQLQDQTHNTQESLKPADILISVAYSVLWLFGFARNLASYIVSLGIIPFKTASRLFGIRRQHEQPDVRPRQEREKRNGHGSRHTSVHLEHASAEGTHHRKGKSIRHSWLMQHKPGSGSATSSSSTVATIRTISLPSTPRHTPRSLCSLPPIEASTDSEQVRSKPRHRDSLLSRRLDRQEEGTDEDEGRTKSKGRIDHSTRRILFVNSKATGRQIAPVTLGSSQDFIPSTLQPTVADSPAQLTVPLPDTAEPEAAHLSHEKPSTPHSRPIPTNEFGEFVASPAPAELDRGLASGTESISDKKGKNKERRRSAFKIFSRRRSNSVTSVSAPAPSSEPIVPSIPVTSSSTGRLRRRSPYPAQPGPDPNTRTRSVGVMAVSISDAEVSSSAPASNSLSWLRSRPKKLTKRSRSNSICSMARSDSIPTPIPPPSSTPASILRGSIDDVVAMDIPSKGGLTVAAPPTSRLSPALVSSTPSTILGRTSTSSSIPTNSIKTPHPGSAALSKLRFNPLRDLEAHLYNRHGLGTGPGTRDAFEFCATPVPSGGIRRTNPYELLGVERPTTSSGATKRGERTSFDKDVEREKLKGVNVIRRTSAPAGSISPSSITKPENTGGRPVTPSRAYTQPL